MDKEKIQPYELNSKDEEIEMLKLENKTLKRNLNLSNKYINEADLEIQCLLNELVEKSRDFKKTKENQKTNEDLEI